MQRGTLGPQKTQIIACTLKCDPATKRPSELVVNDRGSFEMTERVNSSLAGPTRSDTKLISERRADVEEWKNSLVRSGQLRMPVDKTRKVLSKVF